jgi:hypothetical protein
MRVSCSSCDFEGDQAQATLATAILARHSLGDLFSDVECPTCFALCYPTQPEDAYPFTQIAFEEILETVVALADKPGADPQLKALATRLPRGRRRR